MTLGAFGHTPGRRRAYAIARRARRMSIGVPTKEQWEQARTFAQQDKLCYIFNDFAGFGATLTFH